MEIITNFNIGDKVCVMQADKKREKCPICDGTGELECKGYKFLCPRCDGIGEIDSESNVGLCFSDQSYEIKGFSIVERKGELQIRYNLSGYGQVNESSCINPECKDIWHDADYYPKQGIPIVVLDVNLIEHDNHTWEGHAYYEFIHNDDGTADGYRSDVDIIAWRYENVEGLE